MAGLVAFSARRDRGALGAGRLAPQLLHLAPWPYVLLGVGYTGVTMRDGGGFDLLSGFLGRARRASPWRAALIGGPHAHSSELRSAFGEGRPPGYWAAGTGVRRR
jgi:hypothetical protein